MRLKSNPVRERLAAGAVVTGAIVFTGSLVVAELAAAAGLDFVIVPGTDADLFVNSITRFSVLRSDAAP